MVAIIIRNRFDGGGGIYIMIMHGIMVVILAAVRR